MRQAASRRWRETARRLGGRLFAAAAILLAHGGAAAAADAEESPRHAHGSASGHVASDLQALPVAMRELAAAPVLPEPPTGAPPTSAALTIDALLLAHRDYVDRDPSRFAALSELASSAAFERPEFLAPLAARNRQTRLTAYRHLRRLHAAGLTAQPADALPGIANVLVNSATGIELCHQLDPDATARDAAYRELSRTITARLSARA